MRRGSPIFILKDASQDRTLTCDLAGLEVVEEDLEASGLGTVVGDDDARAADDLAGLALTVDLGKTGPLAKNLGVGDLDELNVVLSAEGLDKLRVLGLGDGLDENTEVSLALVEGLGGLAETTGKTVVDLRRQRYLHPKTHEGSLDDLLEGLLDRHGARVVGDLDLLDLLRGVGSVGSGVRHCDGLLPPVL